MKYRSVDAAYCKGKPPLSPDEPFNCPVYSAFQRQEIVERTEHVDPETGVEYATVEVVGHWTDYEKAKEQVKELNRKQRESTSSR